MRSIRILLFALLMACNAVASSSGGRTLLVFGDSLSAAYGLQVDQGWVALLQKRLDAQGYGYRVVNASVSGETTSGGRGRLARALEQHRPALVILELGANDALRGLPVKEAEANLATMIATIKAAKAKPLLVGIMIPPNYGQQYATSLADMYARLATANKVALLPFLLEGVALESRLMQSDGLHPNALGQPRVLENVWSPLKSLLER
ncbi:MAG: arylesterase [Pseudomonadota bacterium]